MSTLTVEEAWAFLYADEEVRRIRPNGRISPRYRQLMREAGKVAMASLPPVPAHLIAVRKPRLPKPPSYYGSIRRTAKMRRTPGWSDPAQIAEIYQRCAALTASTGIKHNVDHIIPLQGRLVSGLHVSANLQILTALENRRKHNHWM